MFCSFILELRSRGFFTPRTKLVVFEFLADIKGVGEINRVIFVVCAVECLDNELIDANVVLNVLC